MQMLIFIKYPISPSNKTILTDRFLASPTLRHPYNKEISIGL